MLFVLFLYGRKQWLKSCVDYRTDCLLHKFIRIVTKLIALEAVAIPLNMERNKRVREAQCLEPPLSIRNITGSTPPLADEISYPSEDW